MTAVLSENEHERIRVLRDKGVLEEINCEMLDNARQGAILIPCADGHHFHDLFNHHTSICGAQHSAPMQHPLSLNGGALLIPEESPLRHQSDGSYTPDDEVLLRHLEGAIGLKKPKAVILYAHAPCGMARLHLLSVDDEFTLLAAAKERVRTRIAPLGVTDVRLWFHVCYADSKRRTYQFRRHAWNQFVSGFATSAQAA
ncbi:MAG TPA: hypothetical protein VM103_01920 [Candidatus Paceibacterota bacterium]|nr:hypothetical protein [Candidatus Paceibacterota bacterium]